MNELNVTVGPVTGSHYFPMSFDLNGVPNPDLLAATLHSEFRDEIKNLFERMEKRYEELKTREEPLQ